MNDYIVLVDENGQPYIAHGIWSKARDAANSGRKKATKYIEKIGEGAKARYFYTKEELDAYYNKGKQKAKKTVEKAKQKAKDWSGVTAREKRDSAHRAFRAAKDQDRAADQLFEQNYAKQKSAEKSYEEAQRKARIAEINRRGASKTNYEAAKGELTDAERAAKIAAINYKGASQTKYEAGKAAKSALDKWYDDEVSIGKKVQRALRKGEQNEHAKDLEKAKETESRYAKTVDAKKKAEKELESARREVEKAKARMNEAHRSGSVVDERKFENDVRSAKEAEARAKKAYEDAAAKTSKDLDLWTGQGDWNMNGRYYGDTQRAYDKAEAEYAKTPLGMIDALTTKGRQAAHAVQNYKNDTLKDVSAALSGAKEKVKGIADSAKEKTGQAADKAKGLANSAANKAKDVANSAKEKAKDAASSVKSSYDKMREEFAEKRAAKQEKNKSQQNKDTKTHSENNGFSGKKEGPSPNIDKNNVSMEYIYAYASNSGYAKEANELGKAEEALRTATRNYNRVANSKNASGQDKNAAKREMDKLQKEYDKLLDDLIDELNG